MKIRTLAATALLLLSACVTSGASDLVGRPIEEAQQHYGAAEQVLDITPGVRIYQFRVGTNALAKGCLLNFNAHQQGDKWLIDSYALRDKMDC